MLVEVKQGSTTLAAYSYDALKRRVTETSGTARALYYSANWQLIEERESGVVRVQSVFSPVYVDALVLRDRDADSNGSLEERLWVQQDANWNVTALVDGTGAVVERYVYDPYGGRTVFSATYVARTGGSMYSFAQGFQGMTFNDTLGLAHQRNRWYSPSLGRWTSTDPIRFRAGDTNLYRAIGNMPTNTTDPSGLEVLNWKNLYPDFPLEAPHKKAKINDVIGVYTDTAGNKVELFADKESFYGKLTLTGKAPVPFGRCIADFGVNLWLVERDRKGVITNLVWVNIAPSSNANKVKLTNLLTSMLGKIRQAARPNPTTIEEDMKEIGKALQEAEKAGWLKTPTKLGNGDIGYNIVYYIINVPTNKGDVYRLYAKKVKEGAHSRKVEPRRPAGDKVAKESSPGEPARVVP